MFSMKPRCNYLRVNFYIVFLTSKDTPVRFYDFYFGNICFRNQYLFFYIKASMRKINKTISFKQSLESKIKYLCFLPLVFKFFIYLDQAIFLYNLKVKLSNNGKIFDLEIIDYAFRFDPDSKKRYSNAIWYSTKRLVCETSVLFIDFFVLYQLLYAVNYKRSKLRFKKDTHLLDKIVLFFKKIHKIEEFTLYKIIFLDSLSYSLAYSHSKYEANLLKGHFSDFFFSLISSVLSYILLSHSIVHKLFIFFISSVLFHFYLDNYFLHEKNETISVDNDVIPKKIKKYLETLGRKYFLYDESSNKNFAAAAVSCLLRDLHIFLNVKNLSKFSVDERTSILFHELGHYENYSSKVSLGLKSILYFIYTLFQYKILNNINFFDLKQFNIAERYLFAIIILNKSVNFFLIFVYQIMRQYDEFNADKFSLSKHPGIYSVTSFLKVVQFSELLQQSYLYNLLGFDHPSIYDRIEYALMYQVDE